MSHALTGKTRARGARGAKPGAASADEKLLERELLARLGLSPGYGDGDLETAHEEVVAFLATAPGSLRRWAERQTDSADEAYTLLSSGRLGDAPRSSGTSSAGAAGRRSILPSRRLTAAVAVVAAVAVGVLVYRSDDTPKAQPSDPQAASSTAPSTGPDQAQVAKLMTKLAVAPKDVATLVRLGDLYFQAGDYATAGRWMEKAVAAQPDNVEARLALGAARYNEGDVVSAERHWLRVVQLDPKNVEAYYDLGFLYLSETPPDAAKAKKAWGRVVEIAPNSPVAKTIATHLKGLEQGVGTKEK